MASTASAAERRSTVIVANALAAQQWEMHLAAAPIRGGAYAWETPAVLTYAAWLDELWLEQAGERGPALTANQSFALWRRVLAESEEGGELIEQAGAAEWAAAAWQLLHRWRIDPKRERAAAGQLDYRALLAWCRSYRERLDAHGWVDRAEIEGALELRATAGSALVAADLNEPYPARTALFAQLAARGAKITAAAAPPVAADRRAARLADAAEELRAAFAWAKQQLAANPSARVALVVPTAARRHNEIDRLATAAFGTLASHVCWSDGRTLAAEPAVGAARNALTLLAASTPYAAFGRWLRSPFFATANEQFARARLDRELRAELRSQLPFQSAYRSGIKELLAARAPESAQALARALAATGAARSATPSRWAHLCARYLAELGWQPPSARNALLGWQSSLDELARLTPILGTISLDTALAEIERIHERPLPTALPISGVHVLGRIDGVGPGYDAVWATGFTDAAWPMPPHGNPLLPVALQRAHGMPYSSPSDAHGRSERALARLVQRAAQLVVSWPARVYDYETEPSPVIREWPSLSDTQLHGLTTAATGELAARRETVNDVAPALSGTRLPGGTGALGRQARCPLRAFCQDRLGARPLEPLGFGLPKRLRGIATHRAAETLLKDLPGQAELVATTGAAIAASVERALAALFGRARGRLAALYELEAEQLQRVLTALLRREAARAPFRVRAVEQKSELALGRWTLGVRIDRLDELADGSIAIIDYKTGERATSSDWFGPRLRDAQVPLYASHVPDDAVGAAVVARLTSIDTHYFGFWRDAAFPGRQSKAAHPEIPTQLRIWRTELLRLAEEFAAGDTRIVLADYADAEGAYAPLTRVFEQVGLARGALSPW